VSALQILNALPLWALAAVVIGLSVAFAVGLQLLVRWRYGVDVIVANHEVAGFKYAVVGVAYAVLLAFVVVGVWEEFEGTRRSVDAEAERYYNLYRTTYNFPGETGQKMRDALMDYAVAVRDDDWPEMEQGRHGSVAASKAYTRLSYTVGQTKSQDIALLPSILHAFDILKETADLRLERLSDVGGHVTPLIWGVLLLGGVITLAYPAFFATRNVLAQVLMTAGLAMIVGATLLLALNLNYPFSGPERVTSAAIDRVIERMREEDAAGGR
jgi:Protein of unknown function (DUF4239)